MYPIKYLFAADAFAGRLFGVWNTQANDGTWLSDRENEVHGLSGAKTFATGAGYVSRPIITAALPNGAWQMCVVPLDAVAAVIEASWWHPMGMKASRSYKMTFENAPISTANLLGAAEQLDTYMPDATPENSECFLLYANRMRTAIEWICVEVMALCQKCVGARGLNRPYHFERIIRDLSTSLRQPAPDDALADVGRHRMHTHVPAGELWKVENEV